MFVTDAAASSTTIALTDQPPPARLGDDGPAILGIFTGQGAQWASMGRNLILQCRLFRESIERCEKSLAALGADAPTWSLIKELLAGQEESHVAEAAFSQPLCTAVQIGLVDLLRASGVRFRAVVGHSSGEIAAAYAAGILPRASDAIRIAYYRGLHTKLVVGRRRGAMIAVGLSFDDASNLCARPEYAGRVSVAADNAPTSVTLSGDADVVDQLKTLLETEGTFARKLKVDMAYHSRHMEACAPAYLASLRTCAIQVQQPINDCVWISSVRGDIDAVLADDENGSGLDSVRDQYWVDNLTSTVLFGPAVECALWRGGPFDAVAEIGPHPALKSPATQIFKAFLGASLPYFSVMQRGKDEVEAFSAGLGYLWEHFGPAALIDFDGYRQAFCSTAANCNSDTDTDIESIGTAPRPPQLAKGLPAYSWDHAKVHWRESRVSRNFRLADRPCHDLLGRRVPDDTPGHMRWRNVLRLEEMPWIKGHMFQGQCVLPGVSYISAIIEATKVLTGTSVSHMKLVDLCDIVLHKAVVMQENRACEFLTDLRLVHRGSYLVSAEFSFSTAHSDSDAALEMTCSGRIEVHLTDAKEMKPLLPLQNQPPPNLSVVDVDMFYLSLKKLGLAFSGPFLGTKSAQRSLGYASTSASWDVEDDLGSSAEAYSVHPAILDSALHALFAAFASPATEQLWTPYLPVAIRRASIVLGECPGPYLPSSTSRTHINAHITAQVTASSPKGLEGDIQVMFGGSGRIGVQVEGVELRAIADQTGSASDDRVIFSHVKWDSDISTGVVLERKIEKEGTGRGDKNNTQAVDSMGRTALYYYRTVLEELSSYELQGATWHHQMFMKSAQHWVDEVRGGRHPTVKYEWLNDTKEDVWQYSDKFQDCIDIILMRAVGENLASIIRGEMQALEVMMKDNMLSNFYIDGHGLDPLNNQIARAVGQITHRYPQANILEVGAGTGGTTRKVLREIGNAYSHYTFTDISPGFFERAADKFSDHVRQRRMTFQVLDIEKDIINQGFSEGAYDVIVAANVIHATQYLESTMRQLRRLLKPGGFLIMMEVTGDLLRLGLILGILSGWWVGPQVGDENRKWGPGIPISQWDDLLKRTGFSGVDYSALDSPEPKYHYLSMLVSQAIDDRVHLLRSPLNHLATLPVLSDVTKLLIIGGETVVVAHLAQDLTRILAPWPGTIIETVTNIDQLVVCPDECVSAINLTELDQPLFGCGNMTAARLQRIQALLQEAQSVLWVTAGCRGLSPEANMVAGITRAIRAEQRDINLQLLDVGSSPKDADSLLIAQAFVRLSLADQPVFTNDPDRQSMLWATETELAFDAGSLLIPRLVPSVAQNERYNAARRIVTKQINVGPDATWDLEVECTDGVLSLTGVECTLSRRLARANNFTFTGKVFLEVQLSVALINPEHQHFLCYGSINERPWPQQVFAVTRSNKSVALVNIDSIIPSPGGDLSSDPAACQRASKILEALAGQLIARSLVPRVPRRGSVLFYEPAETFARAIAGCRLWKGRQVYYAASSLPETAVPEDWILIDIQVFAASLRQKLPGDIAAVVDFSAESKRNFPPCLPPSCVVIRFEPAFLDVDGESLNHAYTDALSIVDSEAAGGFDHKISAIPRSTLPGRQSSSIAYPSIVDCCTQGNDDDNESSSTEVTVQVKPLSTTDIFSSSKTHFMVGLNGDLGQSICGFMARNGARHIAIASRRGEVNPDWLEKIQRQGIDVRVYKMDVTDKEDIHATLKRIQSDGMPPIGGIANGTLVLRDKLFLNMDAASWNDTLRSKVDGSRHLDELFGNGAHLDYFVLFSSLATIAGNAGQSNYHAANMFMAGLAANRRARGLAASVMHVAVVADAGYVTRQGRQLLEHLRKQFFMPTSETDAHQLFAEAVLASPADSGLQADICMGLQPYPVRPDNAKFEGPAWLRDPRLAHFIFIQPDEDEQAACKIRDGEVLPLKQRIDGTGTVQAAAAVVQEAFAAKLETLMQLDAGSIDMHKPLLDLGFDSLLAVETRTWFLREISVDVPVLRFLGSDTIHDICADAGAQYLTLRSANDLDASDKAETNARTMSSDSDALPLTHSPPLTSGLTTPGSLGRTNAPDVKPEAPLTKRTWTDDDMHPDPIARIQPFQPHVTSRNTSRVEKLSYLQSRLWSLGQYLDDPTAANITVSYTITGPLDVTKLHRALTNVVDHHPTLRTCFYIDDKTGEPVQGLLRQPSTSISLLKQVNATTRADGIIDREFQTLKKHEWDLASGETFGATLVYLEDEDAYIVIFGYHLIVMDGVSWSIFLRDLGRGYAMQPLSQQVMLYIDAAVEQRRAVEFMSGDMQEAVAFWQRLYADLPEPVPFLPMASANCRRPLVGYEIQRVIRNVDSHLVAQIKYACMALRVTPFHFHLATVQALFSKLLPSLPELCIGIFDANRPDDGSASDTVGYFVNVLPLRFHLDDKQQASFADVVRRTSAHVLEARHYNHVPFDVILNRANVPDDASVSPLCQVAFNYRVGAMAGVALGDCRLAVDDFSDAQNRYDFSFGFYENVAGTLAVHITCKSYIYNQAATEFLIGVYVHLLEALALDASRTVPEYALTGAATEYLESFSFCEQH
ncbi:acyl transferase domain-containing protein, partial [Rhexocercosporidium sp. MPI-PUGE-AT-0058]